jgi:hypothetical protein
MYLSCGFFLHIVYSFTGSCTKCSIYTLSSALQSYNIGKADFRARATGMPEAGSNHAKVAELMKVNMRTVKQ